MQKTVETLPFSASVEEQTTKPAATAQVFFGNTTTKKKHPIVQFWLGPSKPTELNRKLATKPIAEWEAVPNNMPKAEFETEDISVDTLTEEQNPEILQTQEIEATEMDTNLVDTSDWQTAEKILPKLLTYEQDILKFLPGSRLKKQSSTENPIDILDYLPGRRLRKIEDDMKPAIQPTQTAPDENNQAVNNLANNISNSPNLQGLTQGSILDRIANKTKSTTEPILPPGAQLLNIPLDNGRNLSWKLEWLGQSQRSLLHMPKLEFPASMLQGIEEQTVEVIFQIDASGKVVSVSFAGTQLKAYNWQINSFLLEKIGQFIFEPASPHNSNSQWLHKGKLSFHFSKNNSANPQIPGAPKSTTNLAPSRKIQPVEPPPSKIQINKMPIENPAENLIPQNTTETQPPLNSSIPIPGKTFEGRLEEIPKSPPINQTETPQKINQISAAPVKEQSESATKLPTQTESANEQEF